MHLCIGWELCHKFCSTPGGQLVRALLHKTWKISEEWIWIILYRRKTSLNSITMIKPFRGIAVCLRRLFHWNGDSNWTVTMNCLQSIHKNTAWFIPQQPVTYKDDNLAAVKVETSNLSILPSCFERSFLSLCGPNQHLLFSPLFSETDFRDVSGGWKQDSWQKQRRQTCCRDHFLWALG